LLQNDLKIQDNSTPQKIHIL